MENISHYVRQLLNGDESVLVNVLMCFENRTVSRLESSDTHLFPHLIQILLKDGRRALSSCNSASRTLPTESAISSLRIMQAALTPHDGLYEQARRSLLEASASVCREFYLDRYFGLHSWMIPYVVCFIVSLIRLFGIRDTDILCIPANIQLFEHLYGRMRSSSTPRTTDARELRGTVLSVNSSFANRRPLALPRSPNALSDGQNPLFMEGKENVWMSPQFPTPVLDMCREFGTGCDPKFPGMVSRTPPTASPLTEETSHDGSARVSRHSSRQLNEALCFEHEWSSLLQSYLSKGTTLMWGNWSSISGREVKVPTHVVTRKKLSPPCVIQPLGILMPIPVVQIACGANSSYIITADNKIHSCGCGHWGQLGTGERNGDTLSQKTSVNCQFFRVLIKNEEAIIKIAAGSAFASALSHRYLHLWGQNSHGQCLSLENKTVPCPRSVMLSYPFGKVTDVACGSCYGALAFADGKIGTWGVVSMLGVSSPLEHSRPRNARKSSRCSGALNVFQVQDVKVRHLRSGPWHCIAITEDGQVFSWGEGRDGRLGHGNDQNQEKLRRIETLVNHVIIDASCGSFHSSVLSRDGLVFVFGENAFNQLGLQGQHSRFTPEQLRLPKRAIALSCGREHTCILLEDGEVMACGTLRGSGLGYGYGARFLTPQRAFQSYVIFSFSSGSMHGMALGLLRTVTLEFIGLSSEVSREALDWVSQQTVKYGVRKVAIGMGFVIVVTDSGEGYAFGQSQKGQLGCGPFSPAIVLNNNNVYKICMGGQKIGSADCGMDFALAVATNGTCFSWGWNSHGQLGHGDDIPLHSCVNIPRLIESLNALCVVQVACGGTFSLALTQDGELYAWGEGRYCGLGDSCAIAHRPTLVRGVECAVAVAAGLCHAVVLSSKNIIYTWGRGPLGNGGKLSTMTLSPISLAFPHNVRQLGCGPLNSYAITDGDDLFLWGFNDKWQFSELQQVNGNNNNNNNNNNKNNTPAKFFFSPTLVSNQVRDVAFALTCAIILKKDGSSVVKGRQVHSDGSFVSRYVTTPKQNEWTDSRGSLNEVFSSSLCVATRCFGGYDMVVNALEWKRPKTSAIQEVIYRIKQRVGMESIQVNRER